MTQAKQPHSPKDDIWEHRGSLPQIKTNLTTISPERDGNKHEKKFTPLNKYN